MNANELAEIQAFKTEELTMWERNHTATMLRQQQAEIEALKLCCPKCGGATGKLEVLNVSAKTLTDEEISQVYKEVSEPFGEKRLYEIHSFARAILKKASEK